MDDAGALTVRRKENKGRRSLNGGPCPVIASVLCSLCVLRGALGCLYHLICHHRHLPRDIIFGGNGLAGPCDRRRRRLPCLLRLCGALGSGLCYGVHRLRMRDAGPHGLCGGGRRHIVIQRNDLPSMYPLLFGTLLRRRSGSRLCFGSGLHEGRGCRSSRYRRHFRGMDAL